MPIEQVHGLGVIVTTLGMFILVVALELFWPARAALVPVAPRWRVNGALYAMNFALVFAAPISAFGVAIAANANGFGLFQWFELGDGPWVVFSAWLVLDLSLYLLHLAYHRLPWLWRLHRTHHADADFDISTGVRFHPLETVVTVAYRSAVAALLGPPLIAMLVHELLIIAFGFYTHGNLRVPTRADRLLRLVLVTPPMHSIHHSVEPGEGGSNLGGVLSIWDRLFGTYVAQPAAGQSGLRFGLADLPAAIRLRDLLVLPFRARPA
ncbi:MAG: sterol desaturase family protein [Chromatiales bacterium]|nr:sterol desaturase family protein [Chromatiales bacterium]